MPLKWTTERQLKHLKQMQFAENCLKGLQLIQRRTNYDHTDLYKAIPC